MASNRASHTARPLHPLVEKYLTLDENSEYLILTTVSKKEEEESPLVKIMQSMAKQYAQPKDEKAVQEILRAANQASLEPGEDRNLFIYFLCTWAKFSLHYGRDVEALSLLQRARSIFSKEIKPAFLCLITYLEVRATQAGMAYTSIEDSFKKILELLPHGDPARRRWVRLCAYSMAIRGLSVEFNRLMENESFTLPRQHRAIEEMQFVNHVETGQLELANTFMQNRNLNDVGHYAGQVKAHSLLLKLILQLFEKDPDQIELNWVDILRAVPRADPPLWLKSFHALCQNRKSEALSSARLQVKPQTWGDFGIISWNLVRAELACKNADAAKKQLEMRHAMGEFHYMDDFFLARIHLLQGERQAAGHHFLKAINSIKKYHAEGRLDMELKLATEISPADLVWLARFEEKGPVAEIETAPKKQEDQKKTPRNIFTSSLLKEAEKQDVSPLVGASSAIKSLRTTISKFALLDRTVFIHGETGTGKELVAWSLHHESPRKKSPFLAINCSAIAETLLESELFGHAKGAFTGADMAHKGLFLEAGDGTLFLDEIGDISPRLQVALLRVLESGDLRPIGSERTSKVACRIIAATNAKLEELCEKGLFRSDLMYRLQRLQITIPPLRSRPEDIILLAQHFMDLDRRPGVHASISTALQETLRRFHWPGNVRELRNEIERMRLMNSDKLSYDLPDLSPKFREPGLSTPESIEFPQRIQDEHVNSTPLSAKPIPSAPVATNNPLERSMQIMDSLALEKNSSLRRLDHLRELFRKYKKLTRLEISKALEIAKGTATRDLKALCQEGFIVKVTPTASHRTHYFTLK